MTKPRADRQMAELAVAIHGVLAALHALGIVYNARRHNRFETIAHSAACAFDLYAVGKHVRQISALGDERLNTSFAELLAFEPQPDDPQDADILWW